MHMLIDVRTPEEYAEGHAPGALNIPLADIMAGDLHELATTDHATEVRLYCRSGGRAESARQLLAEAGFTHAMNIGGLEHALRES